MNAGNTVRLTDPAEAGSCVDHGQIGSLVRCAGWIDDPEDALRAAEDALRAAGSGRCAVAVDWDEYGAQWQVLTADQGGVRVVHARYVLNADLDDPDDVETAVADLGEDPRERDVAGLAAAREAAELFGTNPQAMLDADLRYPRLFEEIGTIGGPVPWWDALNLPWPSE